MKTKQKFEEWIDDVCIPVIACGENKLNIRLRAITKLILFSRFINEGWNPDWDISIQPKWCLEIRYKKLGAYQVFDHNISMVYFQTEEKAQQAIEVLGEELIMKAFGKQ